MSFDHFVVSISVSRVWRSQLWTARKPMQLGYHLPWKLEKKGESIFLRHKRGLTWEVTEKLLEHGQEIELPKLGEECQAPIGFRIHRATQVRPAFESFEVEPDHEWKVFSGSGEWINDVHFLKGSFSARSGKSELFAIRIDGSKGVITPLEKDIKMSVEGDETSVPLTSEVKLPLDILQKTSVHCGSRVWRFSSFKKPAFQKVTVKSRDEEATSFRRILTGIFAATASLFVLLSFFTKAPQKPSEENKETPRFAKIILKKGNQSRARTKVKKLEPRKVPQKKMARSKQARPVQKKQRSKKLKAQKVSQSVLAAKALQKSMGRLLKGGSRSFLSKSKSKRSGRYREIAGVFSGVSQGTSGGSATSVDVFGEQNAGVDIRTDRQHRLESGGRGDGQKGGAFLSVDIGSEQASVAEEGLSREQIYRVISSHLSEVRNCYEKAILRKPDVRGRVVVDFTISKKGKVKNSTVKSSTLSDRRLSDCLLGRLAKWKFPSPKGNIDVGVLYPFIFRRL